MNKREVTRKIEKLNVNTALSAAFALIVLLCFSVKLHLMGADFYASLVFFATALYVFCSARQIMISNNMLNVLARKYDCSESYSGNTFLYPKRAQERLKIVLSVKSIDVISNEIDNTGLLSESTYSALKQSGDVKFYGEDYISSLSSVSQALGVSLSNELEVVSAAITKSDQMGKHFDIRRDYITNAH